MRVAQRPCQLGAGSCCQLVGAGCYAFCRGDRSETWHLWRVLWASRRALRLGNASIPRLSSEQAPFPKGKFFKSGLRNSMFVDDTLIFERNRPSSRNGVLPKAALAGLSPFGASAGTRDPRLQRFAARSTRSRRPPGEGELGVLGTLSHHTCALVLVGLMRFPPPNR